MTTMDRDSCANLGVLGMFDAMFRPAAALAAKPEAPDPDFPLCPDCGDELVYPEKPRCSACQDTFDKQDEV